MKNIILFGLFLLFSLVSPSILLAQEANKTVQQSETRRLVDAFDLVSAAYRGRFETWGIPGYARLDQAYRGGQITASDLIAVAIEAERLPPVALEDKAYIHAVDTNLYGLVTR